MITEQHIYTTLISYLNGLIDEFDFFIGFQNNKLPKKYGVIYNISSTDKKRYKKYFDRDNPKERLDTHRVFLIQVDLNSTVDNLLDIAEKIKRDIQSDKSCLYFAKNGLSVTGTSTIRNLPEIVKDKYRYRRVFDITIEFIDTDIFEVDYILDIDIQKKA